MNGDLFAMISIFVGFQFSALADQRRDRFRNIRHTYSVEVNGKTIEATWEVRHDSELGLPSTFDRDVWWEICARYTELQRVGNDDFWNYLSWFATRISQKYGKKIRRR